MKQRVDLSTPKAEPPKLAKCPACGGPASNVRSKRTRIVLVNDEQKLVTDKRWTNRGVICFASCGYFPPKENAQQTFDWDAEDS
jgi:hypothetical protein